MVSRIFAWAKVLIIVSFIILALRFALLLVGIGGYIPFLDPLVGVIIRELNYWGAEIIHFTHSLLP